MQIVPMIHPLEDAVRPPTIDERITELVDMVRAHRERIATLEARTESAKAELRQLLELRGENWSDDEGYARIVPESKRTSYETRSLDELIIHDPLHYGWLKDYRKESTIRSSIQIR